MFATGMPAITCVNFLDDIRTISMIRGKAKTGIMFKGKREKSAIRPEIDHSVTNSPQTISVVIMRFRNLFRIAGVSEDKLRAFLVSLTKRTKQTTVNTTKPACTIA